MVELHQRLRDAKFCCKSLNRDSFSGIQARSKAALEKLSLLQQHVLSSPTQAMFLAEREAWISWNFLSDAEESFLCQRSRICWLALGDANKRFYHNSVKANLAWNLIHALRTDKGTKVTDTTQLKVLVEQFYFNLLGCPNTYVIPLSMDRIKTLHPF